MIAKLLNGMEKEWGDEQSKLHKLNVLEKPDQAKNQALYTVKLLKTCKSWSGLATSVEELHEILQTNIDKTENRENGNLLLP